MLRSYLRMGLDILTTGPQGFPQTFRENLGTSKITHCRSLPCSFEFIHSWSSRFIMKIIRSGRNGPDKLTAMPP
jgi:hypothetical protein